MPDRITPDPVVLGFDTSAAHCAAALLRGDAVLAAVHEDMTKGQAERLMPMLEEMLAGAGLAAGAALLVPATASADPTGMVGPLLNSSCSFAQVDAALHDQAPQMAAILDANPDQKAELKAKFDQPVEQRQAEFQQYLAQHVGAGTGPS